MRQILYSGTVPDLFNIRSKATTGTWLQLNNDTTGGNTWSLISSGGGNGEGAGNLLFNNGLTRMMLNGAGQLGLGSTSPLGMLEIQGGADTGGLNDPHALTLAHHGGGYRHWIISRHNSAATGNAIDFYLNTGSGAGDSSAPGTGNAQILTLANQGVGIGTTTPAAKLDVAGNISATGNASFNNMPGVKYAQGRDANADLPSSVSTPVDSITVNVPAAGFVFVSAYLYVEKQNVQAVASEHALFDFNLNSGGTWLVSAKSETIIPPSKTYQAPLQNSWVVPVSSAGPLALNTAIYADPQYGPSAKLHAHNLTAVYLPAQY